MSCENEIIHWLSDWLTGGRVQHETPNCVESLTKQVDELNCIRSVHSSSNTFISFTHKSQITHTVTHSILARTFDFHISTVINYLHFKVKSGASKHQQDQQKGRCYK